MSTTTIHVHCQWGDETITERTRHMPSYAEAKKMKSLALYDIDSLRASLRDWSSSPLIEFMQKMHDQRNHAFEASIQ